MNPVDHPYGGGEGKTGIGRNNRNLGRKTRSKKKPSNKSILHSRHKFK